MTSNTVSRNDSRVIAQGRLWFRFAQILDVMLRKQGARLWVKPRRHAQYGLRQSQALGTRTFILTTRLDGSREETLQAVLQQQRRLFEELRTRQVKDGRLTLYSGDGHRLGWLCRPAWSWISPLIEIGYTPRFFLHEIGEHEGTLKAHVVIAHFHEGVEVYLFEHYRERVEAVLS